MEERRADTRLLCADMVDICWKDERGSTHLTSALLEDIAVHGACLQLERALPLHVSVTIQHASGEIRGNVRYCIYQEIGYFVGVQFDADCEWSRNQFTPQNLLDLEQLVIRRARNTGARKHPGA